MSYGRSRILQAPGLPEGYQQNGQYAGDGNNDAGDQGSFDGSFYFHSVVIQSLQAGRGGNACDCGCGKGLEIYEKFTD
jgi:hypothetical protein